MSYSGQKSEENLLEASLRKPNGVAPEERLYLPKMFLATGLIKATNSFTSQTCK